MENPGLIYLTKTVEPYPDRRQLAAHELAHQWFGNYATPARWRDVWLSEGLTTFLEREIAVGFNGDAAKVKERRQQTVKKQGQRLRKMIQSLRKDGRSRAACLC